MNTTANSGGTSSFSGASALGIVIGAIAVIGGISFYIWRDARRSAPARGGADPWLVSGKRAGSKPPPKSRKLSPAERKRRKRGKAR